MVVDYVTFRCAALLVLASIAMKALYCGFCVPFVLLVALCLYLVLRIMWVFIVLVGFI